MTRSPWPQAGASRRLPAYCGPGPSTTHPPRARGGAPGEATAAGTAAQAALPPDTYPLERLQVIVPAVAATDRLRLHLDRPAVIAAASGLIAAMADCLPAAGPDAAVAGNDSAAVAGDDSASLAGADSTR